MENNRNEIAENLAFDEKGSLSMGVRNLFPPSVSFDQVERRLQFRPAFLDSPISDNFEGSYQTKRGLSYFLLTNVK
jgi:hypothetical protein